MTYENYITDTKSAKWSVCDTHEQVYLTLGGFCKDCRIEELERDKATLQESVAAFFAMQDALNR